MHVFFFKVILFSQVHLLTGNAKLTLEVSEHVWLLVLSVSVGPVMDW